MHSHYLSNTLILLLYTPAMDNNLGLQALYVICSGQIQRAGKWGQIKIQDDPLFGARKAATKLCSDPFCVISGASGHSLSLLRAKSPWRKPRGLCG